MSHRFPRRMLCGAAILSLLCAPCATGVSRQTFSPLSGKAVAPVESALNALRERAGEWLDSLRSSRAEPETAAKRLIPGGDSIGVALLCEGVLVVGTSDPGTVPSPARLAGIRSGDRITHVNGESVTGADEFSAMLSGGAPVTLTVCRDDAVREVRLTPATDASGASRIGAWVRDSTAGVGTLTFIDPETGAFGALGHPIQDADTGALLPAAQGRIFDSDIVGILPGAAGAPGELTGEFSAAGRALGTLTRNTACGIFGQYAADYSDRCALPVAGRDEVIPGPAEILTTLDDGAPQAYEAEILRLYDSGSASRSLMLRITDPALLAATGGIVQGMSGSPIIQDGKLVGAVTHVLVNDPTRGYGIFIENMLEAAG